MNKLKQLSLIVSILVVALAISVQSTTAAVVLDNLTGETVDPAGTDFGTFNPSVGKGVGFEVIGGDYVIDSIEVSMLEENGASITVGAGLYSYDGTVTPAAFLADLGTITVTANDPGSVYTFVPPATVNLQDTVSYWIVLAYASGTGRAEWSSPVSDNTPTGIFNYIDYTFTSGGAWGSSTTFNMVRLSASPPAPAIVYPAVNYDKINQVRVTAPGTAIYESAGGGVIRDASLQEIWIPNATAHNPYEDTYDVIDSVDIDGTLWLQIFIGDAVDYVWIPVGANVQLIY